MMSRASILLDRLIVGLTELKELLAPQRDTRQRRAKQSTGKTPARTKKPPSRKVRALRRLQAQYMTLVRSLPARKRAELRKLREQKGYEAAIKAARSRRR